MKIDINLPITPWKGLGGVELYSHIGEYYDLIRKEGAQGIPFLYFSMRYEILGSIELCFNLINGKLFKITALGDYSGELFGGIKIGMHIGEVLKMEPSFVYDDFEEVYYSNKGAIIETDPVENTVLWISVHVKEVDREDFERGEW